MKGSPLEIIGLVIYGDSSLGHPVHKSYDEIKFENKVGVD